MERDYKKRVILLIAVAGIIKIFFAFTLELGNDEAYYWLYSQHLQWNYFDHPPLVAVWVRLFTGNLLLQHHEGFIRLGSIVSGIFSTWFIYKAVSEISTPRAGWFAACLLNASLYAGIISSTLIMPDSPQLLFWTLSLWMLARITVNDRQWMNWILFGIAAGLCIMSKVHGLFIWIGLGLYILFKKRSWLASPQFYTALLLSLAIASPIFFWNVQYDFITWSFHSKRVTVHDSAFNIHYFLREAAGQLFFNNPLNVLLILSSLIAWQRKKISYRPALSIYNFIGLPLALILLFVSLFRETWPHWSGPAYITLLPLAAVHLATISRQVFFPRLIKWSLGSFAAFLIAWPLLVHYYPGTYGNKSAALLGQGDVTLDRFGWQNAGQQFAALYRHEVRKGIMPAGTAVVCRKWWAAHIEYYFCRPAGAAMAGLGSAQTLHHYCWLNDLRQDSINLTAAYCIIPSDENYDVQEYSAWYSRIELIKTINIYRNNKPAHTFYIYRLSGWMEGNR